MNVLNFTILIQPDSQVPLYFHIKITSVIFSTSHFRVYILKIVQIVAIVFLQKVFLSKTCAWNLNQVICLWNSSPCTPLISTNVLRISVYWAFHSPQYFHEYDYKTIHIPITLLSQIRLLSSNRSTSCEYLNWSIDLVWNPSMTWFCTFEILYELWTFSALKNCGVTHCQCHGFRKINK